MLKFWRTQLHNSGPLIKLLKELRLSCLDINNYLILFGLFCKGVLSTVYQETLRVFVCGLLLCSLCCQEQLMAASVLCWHYTRIDTMKGYRSFCPDFSVCQNTLLETSWLNFSVRTNSKPLYNRNFVASITE